MKRIEFRRHSKKTGPGNKDLSEEGIAFAQHIGETQLRGRGFTHLFVSTLPRTQQTIQAFAKGAGDFPISDPVVFPPHVEVAITPEAMELWGDGCGQAEREGKDMVQAAFAFDHDLAEKIAKDAADAFRRWIATLPEDAHALIVGHSPFFELLAYGLTGTMLPQLQPCEGFRIVVADDGLMTLD